MKDTPIILLDEATSSLDTLNERAIQEMLNDLFQEKTVIIVAHRLSMVVHCDQIVMLDGGRIAERGTHTQLIQEAGLYASLVQNQIHQESNL